MMSSSSSEKRNIDSEEYKQLYEANREKLRRSVDPTDKLIERISSIASLDGMLDGIKMTREDKALKILNFPIGKSPETINSFLSVLKENDHEHVADVFIKKSSEHLMSDDYKLLNSKQKELRMYFDPECGILDELEIRGVFSSSDKERVKSEKTVHEKVNKIVEILLCKPQSDFDEFIDSLKEVGQEHIVYVLKGEGSSPTPPMCDTILWSLSEKNNLYDEIILRMDSKTVPLLNKLISLGVFTDFDKQRVKGVGEVDWQRNELILEIVKRKPYSVFVKFLLCLCETSQKHIANKISGIEVGALIHAILTDPTQQQAIEQKLIQAMRKHQLHNTAVEVTSTTRQSIRVKLTFFAVSSIKQVQDLLSSGELDRLFTKGYGPRLAHKGRKGLKSIRVEISDEEFEHCRKEMIRLAFMTPKHQTALERAKKKLADKIEVSEDLLKCMSLCEYRKQTILGSKDKVRVLMDVMARRPGCEFQELVNAFRATGQTEAVRFLTGYYSVIIVMFFFRH